MRLSEGTPHAITRAPAQLPSGQAHRPTVPDRAGHLPTPPTPRRSGPTLYQRVLQQAIASQHHLTPSDRHELCACEGCGKAYLLTSIWQPLTDEGSIACPRCGTEAVNWDGARGYVAYWQREN